MYYMLTEDGFIGHELLDDEVTAAKFINARREHGALLAEMKSVGERIAKNAAEGKLEMLESLVEQASDLMAGIRQQRNLMTRFRSEIANPELLNAMQLNWYLVIED